MTPIGLESLVPFVVAAYTMWATPGPNNMMLTYSGARFGLRATLPHILGIVVGTALLNAFGILGLTPIIERWPQSLLILKIVGTAWLLRIGWRMARAAPSAPTPEEHPMRFLPALLFQFANPKAIAATTALAALVMVAAKDGPWLLVAVLLMTPPLCFLANAPWVFTGQSIRRFLSTPLNWRVFTWTTGALTAGCALFLWI